MIVTDLKGLIRQAYTYTGLANILPTWVGTAAEGQRVAPGKPAMFHFQAVAFLCPC